MKKTKTEIIKELNRELKNIENLYKSKIVNQTGITKDTQELYSEIIANELLRELKEFDKISSITRTDTYCLKNHCNIEINLCGSNRDEENFAKRITGLTFDGPGLIKDFQIPLKNSALDKGLGKIDLISFNHISKTLYLIELKYEGSKDTLLRATLETYTYYRIVDKNKLIKDCFDIVPTEINVKPAVLVVPNSNTYDELKSLELGNRPKLKALALALDIEYFTLEFFSNKIIL